MYRNLEAELKRKNISRLDISKLLGVDISTVSNKLTKPNRLKLKEAFIIKKAFFPTLTIEYLFSEKENDF